MLIFSRRVGERIFVAPNVWIVLVDVRGVSARIGVDAPYDVRVKREEHVTLRDLHQKSEVRDQKSDEFHPTKSEI